MTRLKRDVGRVLVKWRGRGSLRYYVKAARWIASPFGARKSLCAFPPKSRKLIQAGLDFEDEVGEYLGGKFGEANRNRWIEYVCDGQGTGQCSPDFFMDLGKEVVLIEVKLSERKGGYEMMKELYAPLLGVLLEKPVRRLLAVRNVKWRSAKAFTEIDDFINDEGLEEGLWLFDLRVGGKG